MISINISHYTHDSNLTLPIFLLFQELEEIRKSPQKVFRNILVDESNILVWQGLIVPVSF